MTDDSNNSNQVKIHSSSSSKDSNQQRYNRYEITETNISHQLISNHLTAGSTAEDMKVGKEIALKMDQTYCQDAVYVLYIICGVSPVFHQLHIVL